MFIKVKKLEIVIHGREKRTFKTLLAMFEVKILWLVQIVSM